MIKKYKPPFPSILLTRDGDDDGCDDDEEGNWKHYTRDWLSIILGIGWSLYRVPASLPTALSQRRLTLSRDGDDVDHNDDNVDDGGDDNDGGGGGGGDDCDPIQLKSSRSSPFHKVQDPAISNHAVEKC